MSEADVDILCTHLFSYKEKICIFSYSHCDLQLRFNFNIDKYVDFKFIYKGLIEIYSLVAMVINTLSPV